MSRSRRLCVVVAAVVLLPMPLLFLLKAPENLLEKQLIEEIALLREDVNFIRKSNQNSRSDLLKWIHNLNHIVEAGTGNISRHDLVLGLSQVLEDNLHMPSVFTYLPHLMANMNATRPVFKMSKDRNSVKMVLGIPTVKREVQEYLIATLGNLIESMTAEDMADTLIVVFIAEWDMEYIQSVANLVQRKFSDHIANGLIEVIAPSQHFYPNLEELEQTLGDPMERVRWRAKQNLDYSYLMMYCQSRGTYYVQLEDDIQAKKGFIGTMEKFALRQSVRRPNWLVLDFCQLGFIGKLFRCIDLQYVVQFFIMFYNDKPVDWLLDNFVQTKACSLDKDVKHCRKAKENLWVHYKPSIFQHIGTHSSLKGKVQKLKDKQFGKVKLYFPHHNPTARVESIIKPYKTHTLQRAYNGETYFWGLLPQDGDTIFFHFDPPIIITRFFFRSGNVEHPSDKFRNTTVEVLPSSGLYISIVPSVAGNNHPGQVLPDNYIVVGSFDETGLAEGTIDESIGEISKLRLTIHADSDNWAILSEILLV